MATGSLSLFVNVENQDKYTGTPTRIETQNDLDKHGVLLDLKRLKDEDNVSYWKRLQSVIPLRGGANYEGMTHALTRELGLEERVGIIISASPGSPKWAAKSPAVVVNGNELILYSDFENLTIDKKITIFGHNGAYRLEDLILEIQSSEYFFAELGPHSTGKEHSIGLFTGTSNTIVDSEWVPPAQYFHLQNTDIIPGTISFTDPSIFQREVTPSTAINPSSGLTLAVGVNSYVSQTGDYYINYLDGIISTYNTPSGRSTVSYKYRDFPWRIKWSPLRVFSLRDENYRTNVFETEVMPDDFSHEGLVTSEGAEVYRQIFEKVHSLWGI